MRQERTRLRALCLSMLLAFAAAAPGVNAQEADARQEWEQLLKRFNEPRAVNLFASGMWALTHGAESKQEIEEVSRLLTLLSNSFAKQEPALLQEVGGARGFKDRLAALTASKDDVVAGFAASMLGIAGDARYTPALAKLLEKPDPPEGDESAPLLITSRGRAAVALGLLGAREYVPKFVAMLGSETRSDRSGAAFALGELGAREHAKEVAALLDDERFKYEDDESPIYTLVEMGVAAEYAGQIARVLREEFRSDTRKAAAYALAGLGDRRHAKEIARLLKVKYQQGDAAKALAVMGAVEYRAEIARLLLDPEPLTRSAALLALGVLGDAKDVPRVARHLTDPVGFVRNYAAEALVMLGATRHAAAAVPLVENAHREQLYLTASDFHPLVDERLAPLRARFEENFRRMKARLGK